jgi:multiple sugar transport system ATP-binding protein
MATVVLENVSRIFAGGVVAVRDLSLTVREGELLALVGPSGSGKTTTLRLIAGLERPTSGQVVIGGRVMDGVPPWKRNVAIVFQHEALVPHQTVRDNLASATRWMSARRWVSARRWQADDKIASGKSRIEEVARRLRIDNLLDRRPAELSGGERRRAAVVRAVARRPAVLLLDEPLSGLDASLAEQLRVELVKLQRELEMTAILVTHDQAQALCVGDRVAVMENGRIEQVDTPAVVYGKPGNVKVARLVGEPPMNLWSGTVERSGGSGSWRCGEWRISVPGEIAAAAGIEKGNGLVYGVRPADVTIGPATHKDLPNDENKVSVELKLARAEFRGEWTAVYGITRQVGAQQEDECITVVGRGDSTAAWTTGQPITAAWEKDKGHWFDARGGERLGK